MEVIMRFIHLSDIHYHPNQKTFKKYVLSPLIKELEDQNKTEKIDCVFFTGDLIDKGGFAGKDSLDPLEAFLSFEENFIDPLLDILKLPKESFVFIPGNHDIDRNQTNKVTEKGLKNSIERLEDIEEITSDIDNLNLERISAYKSFENYYYSDSPSYISNEFGYSLIYTSQDKKIGIAGINSSWRCYDENDKGHLLVTKKQLQSIEENLQDEDLSLKVALMHHSFEFLHSAESDYVKDSIIRDYDLLLTGHTHSSSAYAITTSLGKGCILSTSPSNWENNNYQGHTLFRNGFNIIDYNSMDNSISIHFRRYNYEKNCFVGNTDLGNGDSPTSIFELGTSEDKVLWVDYLRIINFIKDNFLEEIEKNLVSYNTETSAPKDLKDIFVMPKVVRKNYEASLDIQGDINNREEEAYTLKELCLTSKNLLLFGPRETGKTTLLYRIALELLDNSAAHKKIPIYLDLKGLQNKDLFTEIAKFVGCSKKTLKETLISHSLVLLLDNIKYILSNALYDELKDLIDSYPNIVIISTYESIGEQDKPADFLSHPISKLFDTANIQYFKSTEIQNLMQRWFNVGLDINEDEKLHELIKNFRHLNIPSTPLAVSMFLWIYEKQKEFRPVNNASMVQNFIEKLFEKHSPEEKYSNDFDFHNKDHLLAQIAYKMYQENNLNYALESLELQNFIKELYKRKKMKVSTDQKSSLPFHEWVLNYFVGKGVLITEVSSGMRIYKFKLNCFFQYYLAKNMIFIPAFRDEVLKEENYLMFEDEIDYYTGLQRYQGDILQKVVERMEQKYEAILSPKDSNESIKINDSFEFPFDKVFSIGEEERNPLSIENLEDKELKDHLQKNKLTNEEKNKKNDSLLAMGNDTESGIIINKIPQARFSNLEILQKSWILAARVLKNSEELEDGKLKDRAFKSVLICSLIFLTVNKINVDSILKKDSKKLKLENPELAEFYYFFSRFSLYAHEGIIYSTMGSKKLLPVIEDYLAENLQNENVSNVEKFTALFLYIDSKGEEYKQKLNLALQNNLSSSVKDFVYIKLSLLHSWTKNPDEEDYYSSKLNVLIKRSREGSTKWKQKGISNHQSSDKKKKLFLEVKERQSKKKNTH